MGTKRPVDAIEYSNIEFGIEDGIAVLLLNRPQVLNALNYETLDEIISALDSLAGSDARVLLIGGKGKAFCSGADLSGGPAQNQEESDAGLGLETHFNPIARRLADLPIPVVCAVNGAAAGGGCGLALSGDFVIAGKSAYFLQPFVNIGLVPDFGATWLLPRLIGKARATAMMMLGERIHADMAADWGLIYAAVEDGDLLEEAEAMARRLANGPTVSYGLTRKAIQMAATQTFSETLAMERQNQLVAGRSDDCSEGVSAFLEKRKPVFRGT